MSPAPKRAPVPVIDPTAPPSNDTGPLDPVRERAAAALASVLVAAVRRRRAERATASSTVPSTAVR